MLCRIPVLMTLQSCWADIRYCSWPTLNGGHLRVQTFKENFFAYARDTSAALKICDRIADELHEKWDLSIGADSREFIIARGDIANHSSRYRWKQVQHLRCLGIWLQDDAGIAECLRRTFASMWQAFYRSFSRSLCCLSVEKMLKFLDQHVMSCMSYKWATWPFSIAVAKRIDRLQVWLLKSLTFVYRSAGASEATYHSHHLRMCGRVCKMYGKWSGLWAHCCSGFGNHVARSIAYRERMRDIFSESRTRSGVRARDSRTVVVVSRVHRLDLSPAGSKAVSDRRLSYALNTG